MSRLNFIIRFKQFHIILIFAGLLLFLILRIGDSFVMTSVSGINFIIGTILGMLFSSILGSQFVLDRKNRISLVILFVFVVIFLLTGLVFGFFMNAHNIQNSLLDVDSASNQSCSIDSSMMMFVHNIDFITISLSGLLAYSIFTALMFHYIKLTHLFALTYSSFALLSFLVIIMAVLYRNNAIQIGVFWIMGGLSGGLLGIVSGQQLIKRKNNAQLPIHNLRYFISSSLSYPDGYTYFFLTGIAILLIYLNIKMSSPKHIVRGIIAFEFPMLISFYVYAAFKYGIYRLRKRTTFED